MNAFRAILPKCASQIRGRHIHYPVDFPMSAFIFSWVLNQHFYAIPLAVRFAL